MKQSAAKTEETQETVVVNELKGVKKFFLSPVKYRNVTEQLTTSLTFYLFSILFEIITSACVTGKYPSFFFFGLAFIHFFTFLIFILPSKWMRKIFAIILLAVQTTISITNDILYNCTGEIFTFDKLMLASEGMGALDTSLINFWHLAIYLLMFISAVVVMFLLPKFIKKWKPIVRNFLFVTAGYVLAFFAFFGVCVVGYGSQRVLWVSQFPSTLAYNTYGYYGFYMKNATKFLSSLVTTKRLTEKQKEEYLVYLQEGEEPVVTDYTGLSEGNNLIVILAESFDMAAIDPVFTPNLYKLYYEDGVFLSNYHSENKTNMSEGMVMFGSYSHAKALNTSIDTIDVMKYTSLPMLLENDSTSRGEEIKTTYYHALNSKYYNRDLTFNRAGFDYLQFCDLQQDELKDYLNEKGETYYWEPAFNNFIKEKDYFEYNMNEIIPDEGRFFCQYTSLSTHGSYKLRGYNTPYYNELKSDNEKLEEMLDNMEAQGYFPRTVLEPFLIYKAAVMDFDEMIGLLFKRLEDTGRKENTTVVLYPDHNTYFDDISYNLRGIYGSDVRNCNVKAYNLGAAIYDQKLAAKLNGTTTYNGGATFDKFVSVNDLYPTICDLFNLPYNSFLCYGQSIFADSLSVMLSLKDDRYIFDDNFYYYGNKTYAVNPADDLDDTYFVELVEKVLHKYEVQENLYIDKDFLLSFLKNRTA